MNERSNTFLDFNFAVIFHNFLTAAKRLIWIALILALFVGGGTYVYRNTTYVPMYSVSATFSVNASYSSTTDVMSQSDWMDANAAMSMAQTFPYVISSENTNMLLTQELGRSYIGANISATAPTEVGMFTLVVTSSDAQNAFDVLKAVMKIYPMVASNILGDTQIVVLKEPLMPPSVPLNPNRAAHSALTTASTVFGAGVVLIFLFSLTRKTVHSAEDLRKLVNLKCLAYVPKVRLKKHSNSSDLNVTITNPHINHSFNESIRNLRVKLQKTLTEKSCHVLLITSTLPNEGKTTVATNLALSLAAEGKKVILIDGDLRKQSLKGAMGIDQPSDGLVEVLNGSSKNFRLLNVPKSSLLLLSGDETTDQPQRLLDSPRMQQVIDLLRTKLEFIIIDTPPAGILSDAATIAKYADATLYVVRQDLANASQIVDSIQALSANGINIVGCTLNQTQAGTTRYGYGSKYSNAYGYNYGYKYAYNAYGYNRRSSYADAARSEDASITAEKLARDLNREANMKIDR